MFESQLVRIVVLFLILGGASFVLFSEFYEDPYRYYEKAGESELYLPADAQKISYYQAGEDWRGYTFETTEESFKEWVKKNPLDLNLEIKESPASASYYNKQEEEITHLYIEKSLTAYLKKDGFSHFYIFDPKTSKAYYYRNRQ